MLAVAGVNDAGIGVFGNLVRRPSMARTYHVTINLHRVERDSLRLRRDEQTCGRRHNRNLQAVRLSSGKYNQLHDDFV